MNGANHGRVQQDWVGEGSSKEAFTQVLLHPPPARDSGPLQGFGMFDAEQDTHNCDFGNTHRSKQPEPFSSSSHASLQKWRSNESPVKPKQSRTSSD